MKTAPMLVEMYGLAAEGKSRRLLRPWLSSTGEDKKYIVGWAWGMEQSGALLQIGDPGQWAERVTHAEISLLMGCTRETVTKALARLYHFSEPCNLCDGPEHSLTCGCLCHTTHPEWRADSLCSCHGRPRRECQSEKLKAIAAVHPHWRKNNFHRGGAETQRKNETDNDFSDGQQKRGGYASAVAQRADQSRFGAGEAGDERNHQNSNHDREDHEENGPQELNSPRLGGKKSRGRKHVRGILARNPGFACANSYALACDNSKRPGIGAGSNQVGFLAHTFGADLFSRQAQNGWLEPRQSLEGFRRSRPQWFDPKLPDAWDCECVMGQKKFNFQEACPTCQGRGFIIGAPTPENDYKGSMPWIGRMILHFLDDRGLDVEWRRCKKCATTFEGTQLCQCGAKGELLKKRGELNGPGSTQYTMEDIAAALGLHVSTVYAYFTRFKRIGILRTATGAVWRKCQRCPNLPLYCDQCPGCGSTGDPIKDRDAQLIVDLTSRTLDKEVARVERQRLKAIVKQHRRWLDQKHQGDLEAAVELALKVLGEWEGNEHLLVSFYNEMRRRFAASNLRASFVNVLFPQQRE